MFNSTIRRMVRPTRWGWDEMLHLPHEFLLVVVVQDRRFSMALTCCFKCPETEGHSAYLRHRGRSAIWVVPACVVQSQRPLSTLRRTVQHFSRIRLFRLPNALQSDVGLRSLCVFWFRFCIAFC